LRISAASYAHLAAAASEREQTVSEFLLACATLEADLALYDRRHFVLDAASWNAMMETLDNPSDPNAALRALLAHKPIWER
jgi:uncharacterized protein (DUF1778 family)